MDVAGQFDSLVASLPMTTYRAGETVLASGAKTGQLFILKKGKVSVLKDAVEVARVESPGAVFGELSAILDQPHTADVYAVEDSQFYVADAKLLDKEPIAMSYVAKILALRIIDANKNVVELKNHLEGGSTSALGKVFGKLEAILSVGGASFET
jgi:CRP/FNR family transcriptional regulator, cyclic AMP receptor protein